MPHHFHLQTQNDPLCGFFRWGSKLFPITNSHMLIVEGKIDDRLLNEAQQRTLPKFEMLRNLGQGKGKIIDVRSIETHHPISFDCKPFRKVLTDFVADTEPGGLVQHPVRLLLVHGTDKTCIHLGISHDVADVKSGNIVLARLIEEYHLLESGKPASDADTNDHYAHVPLSTLKPKWYAGPAGFLRRSKAHLEIGKRMLTRQRTRVSFTSGRTSVDSRDNDFHHHVLSPDLQRRLHEVAEHCGATVNTLFSTALAKYIGAHQERQSSQAVYTIAVSLRKLLSESVTESFRSFMVDCTLRVPHTFSTKELLKLIGNKTGAARTQHLELELGRMENAISLFRNPLPKALVYWIMKRTQGTNILYSNPGVVTENFSTFGNTGPSISDVVIFGCLVPPYDLMFLTPTVNGQLQLDVVYRKALFPDIEHQFIKPFLAQLEQIMTEAVVTPKAIK